MKKTTAVLLLLILFCCCLSGCGKEPGPDPDHEVRLCGAKDWSRDDADLRADFGENEDDYLADRMVVDLTDDALTVCIDRYGDPVVNAALVQETVRSEDENTVTYAFRLRDGLRFSDGSELTAEDLCYWLLYDLKVSGAGKAPVLGAAEYAAGEADHLAGLHLDRSANTVSLSLCRGGGGNAQIPGYFELANYALRAVSPAWWFPGVSVDSTEDGCGLVTADGSVPAAEKLTDLAEAASVFSPERVTSGPYRIRSVDAEAGEVVLEADPVYAGNFENVKPSIPELTVAYVSMDVLVDEMIQGRVNLVSGIMDASQVLAIRDWNVKSGPGLTESFREREGYGYFRFACDFGPTQWKEFRQAFVCLIDRQETADRFCALPASVVHAPYCAGLSVLEGNDTVPARLDAYEKDPERAAELLDAAGFVWNGNGRPYERGSGEVRYREVSREEAKCFEDCCVVADGKLLMPALVRRAVSATGSGWDFWTDVLMDPAFREAGILVEEQEMTFPELLNHLYREDAYQLGVDIDWSVPAFSLFNLATGWNNGAVIDPERVQEEYSHLDDPELQELARQLSELRPGQDDAYRDLWNAYMLRYNEQLPLIPLYANHYYYYAPAFLTGYEESPFFGPAKAIVYAAIG